NGGSDTASVTITINGLNDAPDAVDDTSASTDEDSALASVDLTGNDTDAESDDVEISSIDTTGTLGAVTINGDNDTVSYDPNGQFDSLA
ncbi:Ig-like domain-containing protein, partial [Marinicella litoralis]